MLLRNRNPDRRGPSQYNYVSCLPPARNIGQILHFCGLTRSKYMTPRPVVQGRRSRSARPPTRDFQVSGSQPLGQGPILTPAQIYKNAALYISHRGRACLFHFRRKAAGRCRHFAARSLLPGILRKSKS